MGFIICVFSYNELDAQKLRYLSWDKIYSSPKSLYFSHFLRRLSVFIYATFNVFETFPLSVLVQDDKQKDDIIISATTAIFFNLITPFSMRKLSYL